jgi:predicted enzyme involved in methoxymalonyl-ACP biosynthesis
MTELQLLDWLAGQQNRKAVTLTVADRFGDIGLTGFVSWQTVDATLEIVDFILSCRAMGRQIEDLMAHLAVEAACEGSLHSVIARVLLTARNVPCVDFWRKSGFTEREPNIFVWDASEPYPKPVFIAVNSSSGERELPHLADPDVDPCVLQRRPR